MYLKKQQKYRVLFGIIYRVSEQNLGSFWGGNSDIQGSESVFNWKLKLIFCLFDVYYE